MIKNLKPSFIEAICVLLLSLQVSLSAMKPTVRHQGESTSSGPKRANQGRRFCGARLRGPIYVGDRISTPRAACAHQVQGWRSLSVRPNSSLVEQQTRSASRKTQRLLNEEGVARSSWRRKRAHEKTQTQHRGGDRGSWRFRHASAPQGQLLTRAQ